MIKKCEYCKIDFSTNRKEKRYCSSKCRKEIISSRRPKCKDCNIEIIPNGKNRTPKRCIKCSHKYRSGINHPLWIQDRPRCLDCNKIMKPKGKSTALRCKKCNYIYLSGENNSNWRGGITSESEKIRKSKKYISWRNYIYKRDNYICVLCNKRGLKLNCHHIKKFADYPELRFDKRNGITLCEDCHNKTKFCEIEYQDYFNILILGRENV